MSALWPSLLPMDQHGDDSRSAVSAEGVRIRFEDGQERLCLTSGLWNVPLGYGNVRIAGAVAEALERLSYGSVFRYENVDARAAADALVAAAHHGAFEKVLFSTGGSAANDLAMKLARQYQALRGENRRRLVVGLQDSFHGMTFGAFSLTGEELGQDGYGVDRRLVRHVRPNDVDGLRTFLARMGSQIAAFVVEPVSGSGTTPLADEFVDLILSAREEHGFVLVADEVATGFARTGPLFASERWNGVPDLMILSKALTNGTLPAAAVLVSRAIVSAFRRADAVLVHAETSAGTAVAGAAISATLAEMERVDIVGLARALSDELDEGLRTLIEPLPGVLGHHGAGAFRTVRIADHGGRPVEGAAVTGLVDAVRREGVVVHPGVGGVQLVPALVYTGADLRTALVGVARGVASWRSSATRGRVA